MTDPQRARGEGAAEPGVDHHAAQRAIVRMLYDPAFAEAVRREPAGAGLPPALAALLAGIDPRALRADSQRGRRTLGALVEELKASAVMALDESREIKLLDGFWASPEFHGAVEAERPLVLALADFLAGLCAAGRLRSALLPEVIALEAMQARARREAGPIPLSLPPFAPGEPPAAATPLRLAPGVLFARLRPEALEAVARVDELLFELSLVPGLALCSDGPRLRLSPPDPARARLSLLAVPLASGLSLVQLDDELSALIEPLSRTPSLPAGELLARAVAAGLPPPRARALVAELVDDEVVCAAG